ncbi:MAG: prolyl oligopeptidase family serine peptidase [Bacteroidota bacterium]|jgi:dipeptidyl aminopeptidase/acylaminoacyl peptidase|nr:S9 family peptidase [Sphingobacteriales bacterium]
MKKVIYLLLIIALHANAQERLTPEMLWKFGRVSNPQLAPDAKQILFEVKKYDLAANKGTNIVYVMPPSGGNPVAVTDDATNAFNAKWRPDGKKITFLSSADGSVQLYEINPDGTGKKQITTVNGGISGYKYSPTLTHIAFTADVKLDRTAAEMYSDLPETKARIIDGLFYRHWDSWHDYAYSHVFVAGYSDGQLTGEASDIMKDEKYDAPLQPSGGDEQFNWSPDGKKLAYTSRKLNGTQEALSTNSDIYVFYLETKNTVNLTENNAGYDTEPAFSPDGRKLAWLSMRKISNEADKNRLMVYQFENRNTTEITEKFDYPVEQFEWIGSAQAGQIIYFIAQYQGTRNIFMTEEKVKKTGAIYSAVEPVTIGDHDYLSISAKSPDKKTFVLVGAKQNMSMPTELFNISAKGTETQITFTNKALTDNITWGKVEKRMITTTDGKQMLTWVILPPNFNPQKRYPTLLYCQGGPQSMVSQFFSYRWNFQLMANNGYIVVAPNRRGVTGFGQDWTDAIIGDYGGQCMRDYLSAIDEVSKESWVAKDKRAAVGASFGGYSVYWLAGNHQKRFKTFIAHCGMFNTESWYGSTEEMWFANNDNKGAYWSTPRPKNFDQSPHKFVQNWDSPILVIHNEKDYRVPITQGMEAFTAAQLKGLQSRFLYFPDENHWVTKPQNSVLWQRVYFEWLDNWLK